MKKEILGILLGSSALCSQAAHAQATQIETDGEIVVTAQRREQALSDVPVSANVTMGSELARGSIKNMEDLSYRIPNFRIAQNPSSDTMAIRGVTSGANTGFEQSVATFVDGIYHARSKSSRLMLYDIERVEVLRGPQTTFFGNNAIAGAISVTTRKPGKEFEANAQAYYAPGPGEYTLDAGITLPATDDLSFRLAGRWSGMKGYIKNNYLGSKGPNLDDKYGRASVSWSPSDTVKITSRLDVGKMRDNENFNVELLGCPPNAIFGAPRGACASYLAAKGPAADSKLNGESDAQLGFFNMNFVENATTAEIDLGGPSLIFTSGYYHHKYDQITDLVPVAATASAVGTRFVLPVRYLERYTQISQEVRLQSATGEKLEYMVGAYYANANYSVDNYLGAYFVRLGAATGGALPATAPVVFFSRSKEKAETKSVFAAATLRLGDSLRINSGLRYSMIDKDVRRSTQAGSASAAIEGGLPGPGNFTPTTTAGQAAIIGALGFTPGDFARPARSDKKLMPTIGAQYDVGRDAMTYATYTKGFKAGGYTVGTVSSDFRPENVDAFEVGVKSAWFDKRLTVNVALFLSKYKDLQETVTLPGAGVGTGIPFVSNAAKSRSKGVELESTLRVTSGLRLIGNFAYLNARYSSYTNGVCTIQQVAQRPAPCIQDMSGKRRTFSPKYSGSFTADFTQPLSDTLIMRLQGTAFMSSSYFMQATADPLTSQKAFEKYDARVSIGSSDGRWDVAVIGKNLTNTRTAGYRFTVSTAPGATLAYPEQTRTIGLQLSTRF
ncbi:TonB-dependent receptor [Sphingomonas sp. SRS2]|uniref:TonB-dependent receptor n=1 Tax=Sphingomonas sp. SRS2 TaxID=133190 RepID=UPI0006184235|nr:TonB-dependent receptor [Sphingomonas sp. SRS2]KKC25440.1 hypothetical protein WP12_14495 [Sphingomonas sp. SRS2]